MCQRPIYKNEFVYQECNTDSFQLDCVCVLQERGKSSMVLGRCKSTILFNSIFLWCNSLEIKMLSAAQFGTAMAGTPSNIIMT